MANIVLFTGKGVLCELYQKFDLAYVGGGFEKSIHSVLEPFWAGCQVVCGPGTHRSTEFDYCQSILKDKIQSFEKRGEIANYLCSLDKDKFTRNNSREVFDQIHQDEMQTIHKMMESI